MRGCYQEKSKKNDRNGRGSILLKGKEKKAISARSCEKISNVSIAKVICSLFPPLREWYCIRMEVMDRKREREREPGNWDFGRSTGWTNLAYCSDITVCQNYSDTQRYTKSNRLLIFPARLNYGRPRSHQISQQWFHLGLKGKTTLNFKGESCPEFLLPP